MPPAAPLLVVLVVPPLVLRRTVAICDRIHGALEWRRTSLRASVGTRPPIPLPHPMRHVTFPDLKAEEMISCLLSGGDFMAAHCTHLWSPAWLAVGAVPVHVDAIGHPRSGQRVRRGLGRTGGRVCRVVVGVRVVGGGRVHVTVRFVAQRGVAVHGLWRLVERVRAGVGGKGGVASEVGGRAGCLSRLRALARAWSELASTHGRRRDATARAAGKVVALGGRRGVWHGFGRGMLAVL